MLLAAANSAGGHSTVDALAAIALLIWIVAGAVALLGWAGRRLQRWQPKSRLHARPGSLAKWVRARTAHDRGAVPAVAPAGAPTSSTGAAAGIQDQPHVGTSPASTPAAAAPALQQPGEAQATATLRPPAIPDARHSPETLELLGQHLDGSRRLAAVEARLVPVLDGLPRDRWLVDRYVMFAGHRIPFLILGETGVFALWAVGGRPRWSDVPAIAGMADEVKRALPGYTGTVQTGICRALAPTVEPRWWCRAGEAGAWVMGLNQVTPWLEHFGPEHGLGVKDIECLRQLAGPHWERGVTDLPLSALVPEIGRLTRG